MDSAYKLFSKHKTASSDAIKQFPAHILHSLVNIHDSAYNSNSKLYTKKQFVEALPILSKGQNKSYLEEDPYYLNVNGYENEIAHKIALIDKSDKELLNNYYLDNKLNFALKCVAHMPTDVFKNYICYEPHLEYLMDNLVKYSSLNTPTE